MKTLRTFQFAMLTIISMSLLFANNANAQKDKKDKKDKEEKLERPKNIGVSDFDSFKNSSFDLYDNTIKLDTSLTTIEGHLLAYKQDKSKIDAESLKADVKSLKNIGNALPELKTEVKALKGKSETLLKNAKDIKPKTKAPKATKNTKTAVKALDLATKRMGSIAENQKTALSLAKELLGGE